MKKEIKMDKLNLQNNFIFEVQVLPHSKLEKIVSYSKGVLKVKISSLPVNGEANKALIKFLSKKLSVSKSQIEIIVGTQSKNKRIKIFSYDEKNFASFLEKEGFIIHKTLSL